MRVEFSQTIVQLAQERKDLVFLSGDLGYMALEGVRDALGERFINAGVAEQNMVSVAAGLAAQGYTPIVYSIAPFATLRPYEQIRNDACLHNLPVKIVGNGGGYGYGIMGGTHHALEDVGVMRTLPNMRAYVPAFGTDVQKCVRSMLNYAGPSYLRLGKSVADFGAISEKLAWAPFRRVSEGDSLVVACMGPVIENVIATLQQLPARTVDLWCVGEFSITELPHDFTQAVQKTRKVLIVEEHYQSGGLAENLAPYLLRCGQIDFDSVCAKGYPSGRYGSQKWHQAENGLAGSDLHNSILRTLAA